MDQQSPDADTLTFAKALLGWMGANAPIYAEAKAKAFRNAEDFPAAKAWARVASVIRSLDTAPSPWQATVLRPAHKRR